MWLMCSYTLVSCTGPVEVTVKHETLDQSWLNGSEVRKWHNTFLCLSAAWLFWTIGFIYFKHSFLYVWNSLLTDQLRLRLQNKRWTRTMGCFLCLWITRSFLFEDKAEKSLQLGPILQPSACLRIKTWSRRSYLCLWMRALKAIPSLQLVEKLWMLTLGYLERKRNVSGDVTEHWLCVLLGQI